MVKRLWSNIDLKAAILVLVGLNCALKRTVRHKEGYISRHDRDCSWHKMKNKCRLIRPRPERSSFKMTQRRVGSNTLVSPAEVTVSWILNLLWCQHTLQKFVAPQKGIMEISKLLPQLYYNKGVTIITESTLTFMGNIRVTHSQEFFRLSLMSH